MTGVEFYEAIERLSAQVAARVVMITGTTDDLDAKDLLVARSVPLLEKPLDMSQVRALLAEMLSR